MPSQSLWQTAKVRGVIDMTNDYTHQIVFVVCVIVVDESVLALTGYSIDNPLAYFYQTRNIGVGFTYLRSAVLLIRFVGIYINFK